VAVGAQKPQILQPVVPPIPVHVVKLHVQRLPLPFADPAPLASVRLEAFRHQSGLQMTSIRLPSDDQQPFKGDQP
jgi:hypothetical protein